jgi:hypothetical protein
MADAKIANREIWLAKIRGIPDVAVQVGEVSLDVGTDELVARLKAAAPESEYDKHPGQLKQEISKYKNPDRALSFRIMSFARDKAGRLYGRYVEFGHGDAGPRPWWFPTYRAWKKPFKAKLFADTRKALKAWWGS